jgi:hypothetical protein
MRESTPTDELNTAFRQAYQAIVDQTDLAGDLLPAAPLTMRPPRRIRGPLVALAAAGLVLALGGLTLLTRDQDQLSGPIERLALVEAPTVLGGPPAPLEAHTSEGVTFDSLPPADMWIWARAEGEGSSMALFEMEIGADGVDAAALFGQAVGKTDGPLALVAPSPGEIEEFVLPNYGWHAVSWVSGGRWRIAVGYDEAEVAGLAQEVGDQDPSRVDHDGFELAYDGPQILQAPADAVVWNLAYGSPAGDFSIASVRGWTDDATTLAPLLTSDPDHFEVNGTPAVIGGDEYGQWIVWQAGQDITASVESVELSRDLLQAVAEGVRPVTVEEWQAIADSASEQAD